MLQKQTFFGGGNLKGLNNVYHLITILFHFNLRKKDFQCGYLHEIVSMCLTNCAIII